MTTKKTRRTPAKAASPAKKKTKAKAKPKAKKTAVKRGRKATLGDAGTGLQPYQPRFQPRLYPISPKGAKNNALVLGVLAAGAAGVLGYFGWQYFKKKKAAKAPNLDNELLLSLTNKATAQDNSTALPKGKSSKKAKAAKSSSTNAGSSYNTDSAFAAENSSSAADNAADWNNAGSVFPLKKGSKGKEVKAMQQAIIQQYGKSYLPRYGADGDFGNETVNALKRLHLPASIDETAYHVLLQGSGSAQTSGGSSSGGSSGGLGSQLFAAAQAHNLSKVLALLQQMGSKEDYKVANAEFQQYRLNGGVRKTLVNGLLSTFSSEAQKQQIRFQFIRMGLKYDGNKWSLDGFGGRQLVTTIPTTIWVNATRSVQVPANMVLGTEVAQRLDYILFEHRQQYFLVSANAIKYFSK